MTEHVTILGDGAMATVCSMLVTQGGHGATMWGAFEESIERLIQNRENQRLLPGARIPPNVRLTANDAECFAGTTLVLSAIPTQYIRDVWRRLARHLPPGIPIVSVAKGIENGTLLRPTQVIADVLGREGSGFRVRGSGKEGNANDAQRDTGVPPVLVASNVDEVLDAGKARGWLTYEELNAKLPEIVVSPAALDALLRTIDRLGIRMIEATHAGAASSGSGHSLAVLSGPNIAAELARYLPATAVVASADEALSLRVQSVFSTQWFRVYTNPDAIGVELAGATKNIVAIAAGILDGLGAGNNAKSALVTRGLVEITRLGVASGAQADTFAGLAGLGDLITTCVSPEGRNRTLGERIGKGQKLADVLAGMDSVAEGVATTRSVLQLARQHHVEMPITEAVHAVLFEDKDVLHALTDLMTRDPKAEREG
jgi:glycerol-3-phosphate dehydrogenase